MEFFTNRIKITSKWTASYGNAAKKQKTEDTRPVIVDKANFDGKM